MNELISVIVPVYNVELYLVRCVESILRQTYSNLEIILVDDGSSDSSGALCETLAKKDSRIRVIHKLNGGQGSARNAGLEAARGRYIAFVDSDDWVDENMYSILYETLVSASAQISVCGIRKQTESGDISLYYPDNSEIRLFSKQEALAELPYNVIITNSMCNKLFASDVLADLRVDEDIRYEDNPFVARCLLKCHTVVFTSTPLYVYYERKHSTTKSAFSEKEFDRFTADSRRLGIYLNECPECAAYAAAALTGTCLKLLESTAAIKGFAQKRALLVNTITEIVSEYKPLPVSRKQSFKVRLVMLSPTLFSAVMSVRNRFRAGKVMHE